MNSIIPQAHFDRAKPFYPIVMQYIIQLFGFKEIAVRAVSVKEFKIDLNGITSQKISVASDVAAQLHALLGPLQLKSSVQNTDLEVPIQLIAEELSANFNYLIQSLLLSAANVLVLSHELCKDSAVHDKGPLWEFLRHCRNAAGHGGKFNLLHGEPKRLAKWRCLEITTALHGTSLMVGSDGVGLLRPADPIHLLWDIEQAYPALA